MLNLLRPCHPSFLAAYSREQDFYKAISYQKRFLVVTCNAKHTEGVRRFREISFLYGIVLLHGSEDIPKQQVTYQRVNVGLSVH